MGARMTGLELKRLRSLLFLSTSLAAKEIGGFDSSRYWRKIESGKAPVPSHVERKMIAAILLWHKQVEYGFWPEDWEDLEYGAEFISCVGEAIEALELSYKIEAIESGRHYTFEKGGL